MVDADLKIHDIANLHVASSSVFPTTGQANSTLLATELAIRLANHLNVRGRCRDPNRKDTRPKLHWESEAVVADGYPVATSALRKDA
jgi:choline dehydrogenase-like flavoprotein